MSGRFCLFEISWEVCNKIGGIYTVISSKAKTTVEKFGDDYVTVGPWLLSDTDRSIPFEDDPSFADFAEACREAGTPVRVGRWLIPGRPRTILVEFSKLYQEKDKLLGRLWEDYKVDSIAGGWDYIEPVMFGIAAARVIEEYWERYLAATCQRAVVQCHEWMTGAALLHLKPRLPSMGSIFTTHATMLGRALSSLGHSPRSGLGGSTVEDLARQHGVVAKHSMEGTCAREADVFTTVSAVTAAEAELLHGRRPEVILPNGIDLDVIDSFAGATDRAAMRRELERVASRFLGAPVAGAAFLCTSGRYEFHNKGIDLLLDALAMMNARPGRPVVLFVLVPAGNSGVRAELLERLRNVEAPADGPIGISTHNLFEVERDPIAERCRSLGLDNRTDARVKVVHVPIYLTENDGFLNRPYEAVVRAMDLTCFPSFYEPWGYTPQESLALGVPTVTSDYAGFGVWARDQGLGPRDGVTVLERVNVQYSVVMENLAAVLEEHIAALGRGTAARSEACRATARRTEWRGLFRHYEEAYAAALAAVQERSQQGVAQPRRPKLTVVHAPQHGRTPRLSPFEVAATLPEELRGLQRLSRNLWWSWNRDAENVFADLSPLAWRNCGRNPVAFLQRLYPEDLQAKARDEEYLARLRAVTARLDEYLAAPPPPPEGLSTQRPVAYFCAEYGVHESLPIYSGGLGVLAGDHLKSASDLGIPLIAVGLFYRMGYMAQRLTADGEQLAADVENEPRLLPVEMVRDDKGEPLEVRIKLPGREIFLRAWKVLVGRVTLYLLDSNTPSNRAEDRDITRNLYGGDAETRIQQLIALGRGGKRLLSRLGIRPAVFHMNEGHAAFLSLERVSRLVKEEGLTFEAAREYVRATTLFTTHTPVPAGHDRFGEDVMRRYFADAEEWVGVPWDRFFALGRSEPDGGAFNMTWLALNFASYVNGVSKMHGEASRELLHPFWPGLLRSEIPVRSITNGIHLPTWTSPRVARLLGATDRPVRPSDFAAARTVSADALWRAKQEDKRELLEEVLRSLEQAFLRRKDSPILLSRIQSGLEERALIIGFARRFAPYKRAHLLFKDVDRLHRILSDPERPVRVLIAGKAHPRDKMGQDILRDIARRTRSDLLAGRVFFIEDYDMALARALVRGVDVWLNNPTHLLEASGTSGMKAAANGALNLSIGDGWWPEAFNGSNGWQIGGARLYDDQELQDQFDSSTLYRLLEESIVPLYFARDADGLPQGWIERMRESLATVPPTFNTDRMVQEYLQQAYQPLAAAHAALGRDGYAEARRLAEDAQRVRKAFEKLRIHSVQVSDPAKLTVGGVLAAHV
ncbi:MAG TPA: alpha-glucan family phosphorylase, partial [Planctomycetota bacterium]|nr:alpha-glucan family phosphorylase [Planctomycetota bacterium]